MLRATPEALDERQPLRSEDGTLCLTADARIDNREEVRAQLEARGARVMTDSDAELILRAYEVWGEECPARILGDFAFALWDGRRRRLFCANDPMGIKPLYYVFDGKRFLWASEVRPIFEDRTVPQAANLELIGLYLLGRGFEREATLYQGVLRLPPAHSLIVDARGIRKWQYWDVDPQREIRYRADREYAEHFSILFADAVRRTLRSAGPVGACLSGGLDSSSIVCMARHLCQEGRAVDPGLEAFSIVFDALPCDERRYTEEVARRWSLRVHWLAFEQADAALDFEHARHYPEILYHPTLFMFFPLLAAARERGAKVFLWGVGGDEVLAAGFDHLTDLLWRGRWRVLAEQIQYDAVQYEVSRRSLVWNYCVKPSIPSPVKAALRPLARRLRLDGVPPWIRSGFLEETGLRARLREGVRVKKFPRA